MSNFTALFDLDAMLHIVANVQYSAGNRSNETDVKNHIQRFIANVYTNAKCKEVIMFYQDHEHDNFRNEILPEYKSHRTTSDAIKLWKPAILDAFKEAGALGLKYIESDDAISVLAEDIGYDDVAIITSDKDMKQIPGSIYNPFKSNITAEERWQYINKEFAERFFWKQVLTGDPTDMPGHLCGIEGVGAKTAEKLLSDGTVPYVEIVQSVYENKYGKDAFQRANLTYKMVRLLRKTGNEYVNQRALEEVNYLLRHKSDHIVTMDTSLDMFQDMHNSKNLFQ